MWGVRKDRRLQEQRESELFYVPRPSYGCGPFFLRRGLWNLKLDPKVCHFQTMQEAISLACDSSVRTGNRFAVYSFVDWRLRYHGVAVAGHFSPNQFTV